MKTILLLLTLASCQKDKVPRNCEEWVVGYQVIGNCDQQPDFKAKICDVDEIAQANSGDKVLIRHDSLCSVYKIFKRKL